MKRNGLKLVYIYEFLLSINLTSLIWPTYLIANGYSLVQIGLCETVFHVTSMISELPTGVISDVYGRRLSRLIGRGCELVSISCMLSAHSILLIYISFVFSALSYCLESGTDTAYVYDLLKRNHRESEFNSVQGRREVTRQGALLFGTIISGVLATVSYDLTYYIAFMFTCVAIFVLKLMQEIKSHEHIDTRITDSFKHQVNIGSHYIFKNKNVFYVILMYAIVSSSYSTMKYYISTLWNSNGISMTQIGIVFALSNISGIGAGLLSNRVVRTSSTRRMLVISALTMLFCLLSIHSLYLSFISVIVAEFVLALVYISITITLNHFLKSSIRATALSVVSLINSSMMIVFFPVVGYIGELYGLTFSFSMLGIFTFLSIHLLNSIISKRNLNGIMPYKCNQQ